MKEDKTIIEIRSEGFIKEYCMCRYIRTDVFEILKLIAVELDRKFPDRKAKYLEVVAANPLAGSVCENNPAHGRDGCTVDCNYFTMGETNHSQWPQPIVPIWTDGKLNNNFDTRRNMEFVTMLSMAFPSAQIITDTRIKDMLVYEAGTVYGQMGKELMQDAIWPDSPEHLNHHTHVHCWTKGVIDWTYVNEVLLKEGRMDVAVIQAKCAQMIKLATEIAMAVSGAEVPPVIPVPPVVPPVEPPVTPGGYVPDKTKSYYKHIHGGVGIFGELPHFETPENFASEIMSKDLRHVGAIAFMKDWPGYFTPEYRAQYPGLFPCSTC
jgi:hypothetical protein